MKSTIFYQGNSLKELNKRIEEEAKRRMAIQKEQQEREAKALMEWAEALPDPPKKEPIKEENKKGLLERTLNHL